MTRSITSPNHLRDTQLLRTIAEMREADRRVCLTCRRFTALGRYDRDTLCRLHLRSDDICAVMSGVGICAGVIDEGDRVPSLVLAEDDTCGEWEPCA
mgnify:CR=1 FL=1